MEILKISINNFTGSLRNLCCIKNGALSIIVNGLHPLTFATKSFIFARGRTPAAAPSSDF